MERFRDLVGRTGAEVVLTSTWRYDPAGLFSAKNWGIPFIDVVPDMPGKPRRNEILAWLQSTEDVGRYAVLDDEDDELDELPLFQPSSSIGITEELCQGLAAYLLGQTDRDMRCGRVERLVQNIRSSLRGHAG